MRPPIVVRPLTGAERQALTAGLRSPDAFVLRRCQILHASARRARAMRIAEQSGCDDLAVLDALRNGSSRHHRPPPRAFLGERAEQVRALLHRLGAEAGATP
jgi:hypothetical protein